jgi:hypothetical protein
MKFSELKFEKHKWYEDGVHAKHVFPNGFGVSVVRFTFDLLNGEKSGSYGALEGLYEVGITKNGKLWDENPIFNEESIEGWCTSKRVESIMDLVEQLPSDASQTVHQTLQETPK